MTHPTLDGQAAVVTGASRGIGYATANALLGAGARVVMAARDAQRLDAARDALAGAGSVIARAGDVTDPTHLEDLVEAARAQFGRLDIMVNNAGLAWAGAFALQAYDAIGAMIDTNVNGVLYGARAALGPMLAQGNGTIVNISSGAGHSGMAELATYCASKFAVNGFTEALAQEVADDGVRVFGICPGRVATDMQREVSGRYQGMAPERVAEAVVELCGPKPPVRPGRCLDIVR